MKILHKLIFADVVCCFFTMSVLMLPVSSIAQVKPVLAAQSPNTQLNQKISALESKEFLDLTRLVLKTNRDQFSHLTQYIERATTVVVIFFTLLGSSAAVFGLKKLQDVDARAKIAIDEFESGLKESSEKVQGLQSEFMRSLDKTSSELRQEVDNEMEIVFGRAEIDMALKEPLESENKNRMLLNAKRRIKAVTDRPDVSPKTKIRGLAEMAYASKRLGDHEDAYALIIEAKSLADNREPSWLLNYNGACYAALLNKPDALSLLNAALKINPNIKDSARSEADFKNIKELPEFVALVET